MAAITTMMSVMC